jgi:hypothetical protein
MPQTHEGAMKVVARRIGTTLDEVERHRAHGQKWCWKCSAWKPITEFCLDPTRGDGRAVYCVLHRRVAVRKPWQPHPNPLTGRPGPAPMSSRDGDKMQARHRINVEVRTGRRPRANSLPCTDCGHRWTPGESHHHYDHYKGYSAEHHYDVQPVCAKCHARRDSLKARQTECLRGHPFTPENVIRTANGTRKCRECRRAYDRNRRDAAWWRAYRRKRKGRTDG